MLAIICGIILLSFVFAVTNPRLSSVSGIFADKSLTQAKNPCIIGTSSTQDKLFPDNLVVNVKTRYAAKGDGVTDDTQAIQKAMRENVGKNKILYFPQGTYLVSDRLEWKDTNGKWQSQLWLQGQNRATTIIRLKNNAPGYNSTSNPRAVVYTASGLYIEQPNGGGKDYPAKGEGNEAFANYIEDLTIDTGNNRGAIALDYLANNIGAVRNVTLQGRGLVGLDMTRKWIGPALIKNVFVEGFDYGIRIAGEVNGITLEHINLCNQKTVGLENLGNVVAIRNLSSSNSVPAVRNTNSTSLITLLDADLRGSSHSVSAIENNSRMFARNVRSSGYRSAIMQDNKVVKGTKIREFTSNAPFTLFKSSANTSLNLPIKESPSFHDNNLSNWANVEDFGAKGKNPDGSDEWGDDTVAIQKALDSRKSTIYIPPGRYFVSDTLHVRGNVRKIFAMGATFSPGGTAFGDINNPKPFFRIEDGTATDVTIEHVSVLNLVQQAPPQAGLIGFEQATSRTLFLKDVTCCSLRPNDQKYVFRNKPGAGKLFIEDVSAEGWQFEHPQQVWARQLNPEGSSEKIFNNGGKLWVLGLKTEGGNVNTVIHTKGGGVSELFGALLYVTGNVSPNQIAFINDNSQVTLSYATISYGANDFQIHVQETRGFKRSQLTRNRLLGHGNGRAVPLYVGGQ
ncbi:glycoside hydrolase family 55 protein [Plectonema radiosum NIES-515]|uniref:Glycoside hydrolase family 55 protein n=1 Tax=Plectonema radiosum NIES-515 TaxID=2986073 RepID=A0ABT3B1K4_9CYAN|nr:glycoside hydrolase family 55 protein [Plectonema radiosum]MCV3215238.1 glycoside hydrolase family 55 protein [Plectonema radiosum NIES-515]